MINKTWTVHPGACNHKGYVSFGGELMESIRVAQFMNQDGCWLIG
jgi:hypothetical protein